MPFWPFFYGGKKCLSFKRFLNFRAHALPLELSKVGYTNFVKFELQRITSKIEWAFKRRTKFIFFFYLYFANSKFNVIFSAISHYPFSILHILFLQQIYVVNTIFMTVIKVDNNLIYKKSLTSHKTNLKLFFWSFSLAQHKTKAESSNSQK